MVIRRTIVAFIDCNKGPPHFLRRDRVHYVLYLENLINKLLAKRSLGAGDYHKVI